MNACNSRDGEELRRLLGGISALELVTMESYDGEINYKYVREILSMSKRKE